MFASVGFGGIGGFVLAAVMVLDLGLCWFGFGLVVVLVFVVVLWLLSSGFGLLRSVRFVGYTFCLVLCRIWCWVLLYVNSVVVFI